MLEITALHPTPTKQLHFILFLNSVAMLTICLPKYLLTIKCILICCNIDFHELFRQLLPGQGEQIFPQ